MPNVRVDGANINYGVAGTGESVVLLGDAGFGPWQWGWQQAALAGPYRVLTVDLRGVGGSTGTPDSVTTLAADVERVCRDADADRVHLVGFGLGGAVALQYAREYGRARSLVLLGTAADGQVVDHEAFRACFAAPDALNGLFSPTFCEARPDLVERIVGWRREEDANAVVRDAGLDATRAFDAGPLYEYTRPTLVLHGLDDPVVPVDAPGVGESLANGLPNGRFEAVEGRRLCHAEHSAAVNDEVLGFLEDHGR
jgi:pimeloyl-ACP methyl ester carboxylesterase